MGLISIEVYLLYLHCSRKPIGPDLIYSFQIAVIPRQNIVHDVFSFLDSGVASPRLKEECPYLLSGSPVTQAQQLASIKAITQYRLACTDLGEGPLPSPPPRQENFTKDLEKYTNMDV